MTTNDLSASIDEPPVPKRRSAKPNGLQWLFCVLILVCGIGIGFSAAQFWRPAIFRPPHHPPHPEAMAQRIQKRYGLDNEQTQKVLKVLTERHQAMGVLRKKMHGQRREEIKKMTVEMKAIMTPSQFKKWKRDFQDHHDKRRRPRPLHSKGA